MNDAVVSPPPILTRYIGSFGSRNLRLLTLWDVVQGIPTVAFTVPWNQVASWNRGIQISVVEIRRVTPRQHFLRASYKLKKTDKREE